MTESPANPAPFRHVLPSGRLQEPSAPESDVRTAVLCHAFLAAGALSGVLFIVTPILWLTGKEHSGFVDDHGREACNFGISMVIWSTLLAITIIGIAAIWIVWLFLIFMAIRSAVIASNREFVRYPMTIRFL
jgi:hypothetical protein